LRKRRSGRARRDGADPADLPPAAEPSLRLWSPWPRAGAGPGDRRAGLDDSSLYIHRELSQLQFNIRVLEQALDESYPLLERLKFLLIFSSNLDEFFEIRVAGLKKQITFAREQAGADGLQPHQALARISELVHGQVDRQYAILNDMLLPELEKHQVRFIRRRYWTTKLKTWVRRYFRDEIAPIITPIGLDPTHPFPLLVNKSLNFIVELKASTPSVAIPAWRSSRRRACCHGSSRCRKKSAALATTMCSCRR
jgi:polyphosphate kinase